MKWQVLCTFLIGVVACCTAVVAPQSISLGSVFQNHHSFYTTTFTPSQLQANGALELKNWLGRKLHNTIAISQFADRQELAKTPADRFWDLLALAISLNSMGHRTLAAIGAPVVKDSLSYTRKQLYDLLDDWLSGRPVDGGELAFAYGNFQALEQTYITYLQNIGISVRQTPPVLDF